MGQSCDKLCSSVCVLQSLRLFGIHRSPYRSFDGGRIEPNSMEQSNVYGSNEESPFICKYSDYHFLNDPEIGRLLVLTKFMIILRGPPGSGKSCLAKLIKSRFPTTYICTTDNYHSSILNQFETLSRGEDIYEEARRSCESEARIYARQSKSPLVIDAPNMRSFECRPYTEIARSFDYNVILVTPMTPWRFDITTLAEKNDSRVSAEVIGSMINQYEPIIYPLYYGWFFAGSPSCNNQDKASPSKMTEKVINDYYNIFLSMLGVPYVHDALALICGFNTDVDKMQLAAYWSSAVLPPFGRDTGARPTRPHCTAFFSKYGRELGAREYAERSIVQDALLGAIYSPRVVGLFVTRRTVGLRVRLPDDPGVLNIWNNDDNESVDLCGEDPFAHHYFTADIYFTAKLYFSVPPQPRPKGSRAHITLAVATGVSTMETGIDALRLVDAELNQRPDIGRFNMPDGVIREISITTPDSKYLMDSAFYYQFSVPRDLRLMYSAYY